MIVIPILFALIWFSLEVSGFAVFDFIIEKVGNLFTSSKEKPNWDSGEAAASIMTFDDKINIFADLLHKNIPDEHRTTLLRKAKILLVNDGYGGMETTDWLKELAKYVKNHAINNSCESDFRNLKFESNFYRIEERKITEDKLIFLIAERLGLIILKNNIIEFDSTNSKQDFDVRPTNPIEYELFCAGILRNAGWQVSTTKASGDQGADLIAKKSERILLVQCKLYTKPVGNKAVQEIVSALQYYGGNEGAVVTNSEFTISAKKLANANGVMLIHDSVLFKI